MIVILHPVYDCTGSGDVIKGKLSLYNKVVLHSKYVRIYSVDVEHLGCFLFLPIMTTTVTVNMRKYLKSGILSPLTYAKEW